ncbi:GtrA family protein [Collimonas antrihumi]|uniref:GtrA family protein n=1 Tax=Collimonas antrihumi TaxID=1940615 RepID=UPI001B8CF905|nr:GtrA family protein [Collimonas antrihumi]
MAMQRWIRFLIYTAAGAVGTACQYAVLIVLVQSGLATPVPASALGALVGAVVNYGLNYRITFKSQASHLKAASRFGLIAVAGILLNTGLMHVLTIQLSLNYLLAQLLSSAAVLMLTYSANTLWTFGSKQPQQTQQKNPACRDSRPND